MGRLLVPANQLSCTRPWDILFLYKMSMVTIYNVVHYYIHTCTTPSHCILTSVPPDLLTWTDLAIPAAHDTLRIGICKPSFSLHFSSLRA